MKYAAIFMIVLVVIAAALGIYTLANARLQVTAVTLTAVPAAERADEFTALQTAMDQGALLGTPFTDTLPGTYADYSFFTYAFRLKNGGLIKAEMVEIQPMPVNGDVLCYTTLDSSQVNANLTVGAGKERDAWCVVLTSIPSTEGQQVSRSFRVTYYLWGIPRSLTVRFP